MNNKQRYIVCILRICCLPKLFKTQRKAWLCWEKLQNSLLTTSLEKKVLRTFNPCVTSTLTVFFKSNDIPIVWFCSVWFLVDCTWALEEFLFLDVSSTQTKDSRSKTWYWITQIKRHQNWTRREKDRKSYIIQNNGPF